MLELFQSLFFFVQTQKHCISTTKSYKQFLWMFKWTTKNTVSLRKTEPEGEIISLKKVVINKISNNILYVNHLNKPVISYHMWLIDYLIFIHNCLLRGINLQDHHLSHEKKVWANAKIFVPCEEKKVTNATIF